jgi:chorismate mutase
VSKLRGVRGAITVPTNTKNDIYSSTKTLIEEIFTKNKILKEEVTSIIFTATPDLDSAYPAGAAREMGYTNIPLMCYQEMEVNDSLSKCIRCMVYLNRKEALTKIKHIYLKGAKKLRPDIVNNSNPLHNTNDYTNNEKKSGDPFKSHIKKNHIISFDDNIKIGDKEITLMAGPCAVESRD